MEWILSLVVMSVTVITAVLLHHIIPFWLEHKYNNTDVMHDQIHDLRKENKELTSRLSSIAYHVSRNDLQSANKILEPYRK